MNTAQKMKPAWKGMTPTPGSRPYTAPPAAKMSFAKPVASLKPKRPKGYYEWPTAASEALVAASIEMEAYYRASLEAAKDGEADGSFDDVVETVETCWSNDEVAGTLAAAAATLLLLILIQATLFQGKPSEELGKRPAGRGIWGWLFRHLTGGVGVLGYDPVLGSLSPVLRIGVHISMALFSWAALLTLWHTNALFGDQEIIPNCFYQLHFSVFQAGYNAVFIYFALVFVVHHVMMGVSDPGDPRPQKMQRKPAWKKASVPFPDADKWTYVFDSAESHNITSERFQAEKNVQLTGESAGRDIWTTTQKAGSSSSKKSKAVDEKLVLELAAGGRKPTGAVFNASQNPNSCDVIVRSQLIREYLASGGNAPDMTTTATGKNTNTKKKGAAESDGIIEQALKKAVHFYSMLQTKDGHWTGDYGGPLFLLPGLVVAWYVMGKPAAMISADEATAMKHYMTVHQQTDGGWGTHIESPSTMFGTVMNYVACRMLGMPADHAVCVAGLQFIRDQGGATKTSSWAKFYLCLAGCMDWKGHNSVPPELWLLPNWFPFHPGRMWCHARMVYLPMGYLYGSRFVYDKAESDPTILELRKELYCQEYNTIRWSKTRHDVAPVDNYSPISITMRLLQNVLACYENWFVFAPFRSLVRRKGLQFCVEYMHAEDLQTNYIDIGPVNKVLNMISAYHAAGKDLKDFNVTNHMARVADYLWVAEDGMKMKGYNGSQLWDTAFAIQAIDEAGLLDQFPTVSKKVWSYLERCQILSTEVSQATAAYEYESASNRKAYYRHLSKGGWPFSTSAHGWPIADCTGEGLKSVLCLVKSKSIQDGLKKKELKPINNQRLQDALNVLLTYQNEDGGFATYENNRGFGWYESLNPSEVFGDIMIDYSYVELSMAALTGIVEFRDAFPNHRTKEIQHAIDKGRDFFKSIQRPDGSWYGSWACCFCYGTWFGIEGLVKCGEPIESLNIRKACGFLLRHQRPNGGWGEDFTSCYDKAYAQNGMEAYGDDGSSVISTAWALLALSTARCLDVKAVQRGVQYLLKRQLPSGDWPQEGVAGVFNRACGITYTAYRNVFPIWALGRCRTVYGSRLDEGK